MLSLAQLAKALNGEIRGNQVFAPGPGHSLQDRSMVVSLSAAKSGYVVNSFSPKDTWQACRDYIDSKLNLPTFKPNGSAQINTDNLAKLINDAVAAQGPKEKPIATYPYQDRDGTLLYQMLRFVPKTFKARQPNGVWKLPERRVVYRWPELLQYPDATVFVCEGEKDADSVAALSLCATTVASGKWTQDCISALDARHVLIIADADEPGRVKALQVAALVRAVCASVKVIALPGLDGTKNNKDVSDWLGQGHTKAELEDVCAAAPYWDGGEDNATPDPAPAPALPAPASTSALAVKTEPKPAAPLCFVKIEDWLDREPPQREWGVPDRFPLRNVSLLSGEGSVGKTIVLMQLAAAHVLGRGWLDTLPEIGDALYLNAEDEQDELHRRLVDIAKMYDAPLSEFKGHLHLLAYAGKDAVLAHANHSGIVKPTQLFHRLVEAAGDIKPKLIGLDTSADIFAGAENDRAQVRQFIGLLRHVSIVGNSAVMVCAHPSLTGINTGTGLSGSTAWHNSVRARAYLRPVKVDDTEPDKTLCQLEFMKSNYSAVADTITLRWQNGVFVPVAKPGSLEAMAADAKADEAFMAMLAKFAAQGRNVSHKSSARTYAPAEFAKEQPGISKTKFADAMRRLFNANKIRVETYDRHHYERIVAC